MAGVYFLSDGKLYAAENGAARQLVCHTLEEYRRTAARLSKKQEWKTTGPGAMFMGEGRLPGGEAEVVARVTALAAAEDRLIYAAQMGETGGLYHKDPTDPDSHEGLYMRQADLLVSDMDYDRATRQAVLTVTEGGERHLALWNTGETDVRVLTEGESLDVMPAFSRRARGEILFSSAGFGFDSARHTRVFGCYGVSRLAPTAGALEEVLADDRHDTLMPRELEDGTLYYIRRPKQLPEGTSLADVLLGPVRVLKALFGWLNFFTQRYAGESLSKKTGGPNPAKGQVQNPEEQFIAGNLVNVGREQRLNAAGGEKYPGAIPRSWELVRRAPDGTEKTVKRGVLCYLPAEDGSVYYSNGRFVVRLDADGNEEKLCEAKLATDLCLL